MARTLKLAFPLPSRRSSTEPQVTPTYDGCESPMFNPGAKAEMVLGTSEPWTMAADSRKKTARKEQRLRKFPSFMSVTISETDSAVNREGGDGSTARPMLRTRPSSPVLGRRCRNEMAGHENISDSSGLQPRSRSTSTLRSYYDASKSPLLISQQTSASSSRDMALRKGHPTVAPAPAQDTTQADFPVGAAKINHSQTSLATPKKRQGFDLRLDLSRFSYKPSTSPNAFLSPNQVVQSPSAMSTSSSRRQSTHSGRPRWFWERKSSRGSSPGDTIYGSHQRSSAETNNPQELRELDESNHDSVQFHGNEPLAIPQNWFDRVDQCETHLKSSLETPNQEFHYPRSCRNSFNARQNGNPSSHRLRRSKSNISDLSQDFSTLLNYGSGQSNTTLRRSGSFDIKRSYSHSTRATSSGESHASIRVKNEPGLCSGGDLHDHSFLSLSSSEDEEETSVIPNAKSPRNRIRASIANTDMGGDVLVCNAQRAQTGKPTRINNQPRRKRRSSSLKLPEEVPPVPSIPLRPQLSQRVSSIYWREELDAARAHSGLGVHSAHSRASSKARESGSRSGLSSPSHEAVSRSKIMVVTAEEEKLLEAMRRKRASIHPQPSPNAVDGTYPFLGDDGPSTRPSTAETGGPAGLSPFDRPGSLSPPRVFRYSKVMGMQAFAASSDELPCMGAGPGHRDEAAVLPPFPISPAGLSIPTPDMLPSTPSMSDGTEDAFFAGSSKARCSSPITPSGFVFLDSYDHDALSGGHGHPTGAGAGALRSRHDRKRTISSDVIVLDDEEQRGQGLSGGGGMKRWSMDDWSERGVESTY